MSAMSEASTMAERQRSVRSVQLLKTFRSPAKKPSDNLGVNVWGTRGQIKRLRDLRFERAHIRAQRELRDASPR